MKLNNQARLIRRSQCLVVSLLLAWPNWTWAQAIVGTLPVAGRALAVNPVTNKIYVTSCPSLHADGVLVVVDGATNSTRPVTAGPCPTAVAVNPATDKIYLANIGVTAGFGYFTGGSITVIDGSSDSTVTISDPHAPWAVAVNPTTNKIYVANHDSSDVTIIDGNTNAVTTLADPNAIFPVALAVNPLTNRIYVANRGNALYGGSNPGSVTVIDGATNATLTVTDPNAVTPNGVAVDTVTNRIYVSNQGAYPAPNHGNITVIDGVTNLTATLTDPNALAPAALAVNQSTHKIYVANASDSAATGRGLVTVIDGSTNSVMSVTDPNAQAPDAVAVDEATNTIYVANGGSASSNPGSNPGSITIINGATNSTTTFIDPKAIGPIAVALNPATNRVYVTNASASLTVIDGGGTPATHTLGILLAGSGSGSGTVGSVPAGIDCGISACIASFAAGTPVSLSASAASTSQFTGWQGPCSGAAACNVVTNEDEFVTASFNSTSPAQVAVPSVVGETQAAAATAITNVGLVVGTVTQQSSDVIASGDVISESPAAGTNVASGSAVNLVASTGSTGSAGGGGYDGGGGLDSIALGALVAALMVRLRKIRPQERAMLWQRKTKSNRPQRRLPCTQTAAIAPEGVICFDTLDFRKAGGCRGGGLLSTRFVALASIALTLASCGGGSGNSGTSSATISNLTFSPAGAYQGSGNGTATVSGSISFSAPAANVASVSITVISPTGQNLGTTTGVAQGAAGHTTGMLAIQSSVSTVTLGKFTFQVAVIDSSSQSSNTLNGMFTIAPSPWQTQAAGPQLIGASTVVPGPLYEFGLNNGASVVWIFNGTTWTQSGLRVPTPRSYAALASATPLIYVIGGDFPGTLNTGMTVVEAYNGITARWFTLAPLNTGRGQGAAAALNGRIYAMGGWVNGMALNSVETYDPSTNVWTVSPDTLATASGTVSAVVLNGAIYVTDAHGHVDKYDSVTDTWSNVVNLANGVGSAALGTDGTSLFAFGGLVNNQPNQPSAAVQTYDPAMPGPILMKGSMPVAIGAPLAASLGSTIVVLDPSSGATLQYTPADDTF